MPFKDLDIFLQAARAILQASDPYSIPNLEVFYPLPFYFLFVPLVGLPAPLVYALWTALQAIILVAILRRRAFVAAFAMPVLLTLLLGQVDISAMGLYAALQSSIAGGVALAFLVLKPQLVLLLAPWLLWQWWRVDRGQIFRFCAVIGIMVGMSFLIQPDWLWQFFARSGERTRANISSSLWGVLAILPSSVWLPITVLVVAGVVVWAWRKNDFAIVAATGLLVSPYIFSYNLTPLWITVRRFSVLAGLAMLSWLTFAIGAWQSNDRAAALLTLVVLIEIVRQLPKRLHGKDR